MNVFIKLDEGAKIPTKGSENAAGYDIYSNENIIISVGERKLVDTGFKLDISGYIEHPNYGHSHSIHFERIPVYFRIAPRSGLAVKGIDVGAGVVDRDFRGSVKVLLINNSKSDFEVKKGDRIAQGIFERIVEIIFNQTDNLEETKRGEGGFGSTGK